MNLTEIKQLNKNFSLNESDNQLDIVTGKGEIPVIEVHNRFASALISLQGAHILSWIPKGRQDVIWLSEDALFKAGRSLRGGIPICWPWFGAHESEDDYPAHGFARTTPWHIVSTDAHDDGSTTVVMSTEPGPETEKMWPAGCSLQYQIHIGDKLELELITSNHGPDPVTIGQALHTYFRVSDISTTRLFGLDDTDYLDKPDGFRRKAQHGPVTFDQEVDRIYLDTKSDCVIEDQGSRRSIIIIKCGSCSTVVWNPWQDVAEKMGDLGREGYRYMLCVESANAADDVVTIESGKEHHLWVQYEVQDSD